jgi:hypothetical protein
MNLQIIAALVAGAFLLGSGVGWQIKAKLYKAAEWSELQQTIKAQGEYAQKSLNGLQADWEALVARNNAELVKSAESRQRDSLAEAETARTLKETGDAIRKISKTIPLVGNVGVCLLSDDFIRVWNDIKAASETRPAESVSRTAPIRHRTE